MFLLDTKFLPGSCTIILHIYVVAFIGFNQTAYTFGEGDGTVEVCAVFLDPTRIAPNVVIELMGTTSPSKYPTCCVNVYSLSKLHTSMTAAHMCMSMFACWLGPNTYHMF